MPYMHSSAKITHSLFKLGNDALPFQDGSTAGGQSLEQFVP
jgi:hypothetical protein